MFSLVFITVLYEHDIFLDPLPGMPTTNMLVHTLESKLEYFGPGLIRLRIRLIEGLPPLVVPVHGRAKPSVEDAEKAILPEGVSPRPSPVDQW